MRNRPALLNGRRRHALRRPGVTGIAVVVALSLAGTALGGCGSGSTSTSSTTSSSGSGSGSSADKALDRATLAAKANAICRMYLHKQLDLLASVSLTDLSSAKRVMTAVHGLWQKMDREFTALTPDAQTKPQWDVFLATVRPIADLYGQSEAATKAGDAVKNAQILTPLQANAKRFGAAAAAVGATACSPQAG